MLTIRTFTFNSYEEKCYVLTVDGGQNAVVIDPGFLSSEESTKFMAKLTFNKIHPVAVLLTHAHPDHRHGAAAMQEIYNLPIYMSEAEKSIFDDLNFETIDVKDGETLVLAQLKFKVIATPGHTPGSVCYYDEEHGVLFSGDTLFRGTIGRTDLKGGDYDKLIVSVMDSIMGLPGDTDIYPGHGEPSTIADERTSNPFLQPFNEPEEGMYDEDEVEPLTISSRS